MVHAFGNRDERGRALAEMKRWFLSDLERTAPARMEALGEVAVNRARDQVYGEFAIREEQMQLSANAINNWNRVVLGLGLTPPAGAGRAAN